VAGVLAYVATTGDPRLGATLLATVAIGMGTPFAVLAMLSGEIANLPRAGRLPEIVRFLLGLALLLVAFYFARLALSPEPFRLLAIAVLVGLGLERMAHGSRTGSVVWRTSGGAALVLAASLATMRLGPAEPADPLAWRSDVEAALADARAAGRFAVVDFTADWCLACHELERVTFRDPEVAALFRSAERIRVDASSMTERVESLFARFGVLGLPAVVVVDPAGAVVEDARIASFVPPDTAAALLLRAGLRAEDGIENGDRRAITAGE
jgi:thiol:disulfide interchange protein DsbD